MEKVINSEYVEREAFKHERLSEAIKTIRDYVKDGPVSNQIVEELRCEMEKTEVDILEYIFGKNKSELVFQHKMMEDELPF